jgi:hypothetical protein
MAVELYHLWYSINEDVENCPWMDCIFAFSTEDFQSSTDYRDILIFSTTADT